MNTDSKYSEKPPSFGVIDDTLFRILRGAMLPPNFKSRHAERRRKRFDPALATLAEDYWFESIISGAGWITFKTGAASLPPAPPVPVGAVARNVIVFEITASAAEGDRSQTDTFAIAVAKPDTSNKKAKESSDKVMSFTSGILSGKNSGLESKDLQGSNLSGIGVFLGAMLRGFLPF